MVLLVPKKGPKTKPNRKITTHASLLQGPCGFCREPDVIQADSVGDAKTEYGEVSKWSAPSFQILTEKKGLGALGHSILGTPILRHTHMLTINPKI